VSPRPWTDPGSRRLEALRQYGLFDATAAPDFNDLTALAADICETPLARVSFGCDPADEDPLEQNPSGTRFRAAAALVTPEGLEIGTLCVIDHRPRNLDARQLRTLTVLARQVMTHLELRRQRAAADDADIQLLSTFHAGPVGMAIYRCGDGKVVDVNGAFHRLTGWSRAEVQGRTASDLGLIGAQAEPPLQTECILPTRDSQQRHVLLSTEAVELRGERHTIATVVDITDRKLAEQSLSQNARKLRSLIDGFGPDVLIGMLTPDGILIEANRSALEATGLTAEEAIGRRLDSLPTWSYSETVQAQLRNAIEKAARGQPSRYDVSVLGPRGEKVEVDFSLHPVHDDAGNVEFLVPSAVVITERRRAEEHVRQLNRVYAVLSETNENILRQQDLASMLRSACEIAVKRGRFEMAWIGLRGDDAGLRVAAHAGASEDTREILHTLIRDVRSGCQFTFHALAHAEHGVCNDIRTDPRAESWRDAALARGYGSMAAFPLRVRGVVAGTINLYAHEPGYFNAEELRLLDDLALDISFGLEVHEREAERRAVELALRKSEERFREIAANIQEVFWMSEPHTGRLVYVSPAFEKLWGRSCASLYESPQVWLDAIHAEDRDVVARASANKQTTGDYAEVYRIVRPDGVVRWIRDRGFAVRAPNGEILHFVGTAEDITDQRLLEEQLRQAQKLEAIGQLAGGVAHDFNNILTIIRGFGSLLMTSRLPPDAREATEAIVDAAERAANLTRQLLAFGRRQVMQPRNLDLNEIILGLMTMLQRIVGEDIRIQLELHPGSLMTRVDAGMLDQVLLNLVVNARDAMPVGGKLCIGTFHIEKPARRTPHQGSAQSAVSQRQVGLRVVDSGVGIPQEHLAHIFEPFFTTKGPGKGTGLGLATVYGIVTQHRGSIDVRSALGAGTTIEVLLPAAEAAAQPALDVPVLQASSRGEETILVVEDDPHVRALTRRVLQQQGYRVLEAKHGPDALRIWDREGDSIDLLLTDMVMPEGMSGLELARRLREQRPGLKVIVMSGFSPETAGRELSDHAREHFIQKPVAPAEMLGTVRRCLDATPTVRGPGDEPRQGLHS